jgi:hypothetical protein
VTSNAKSLADFSFSGPVYSYVTRNAGKSYAITAVALISSSSSGRAKATT